MPTSETPATVTQLLEEWSRGDQDALNRLMPLIYGELRSLASHHLRRERPDHTLQTMDLVNEAYMRLADQKRVRWQSRAHFLAIAAQMMRRILINHAQNRLRAKRGGGARKLSIDEAPTLSMERAPDLVALDDALTSLAELYPQQARIVEMRYFAGMTSEEIGHVLGVSSPTVKRKLSMARAWLYRSLTEGDSSAG